MYMFFETIYRPVWSATLVAFTCCIIYRLVVSRSQRQLDLPICGARENEWFPRLRAALRNSWDAQAAGWEAWQRFGSRGKVCQFPLPIGPDLVLLPPSEVPWMIEQPDSTLNSKKDVEIAFMLEHTFMDRLVYDYPVHEKLLSGKFVSGLLPGLMAWIESSTAQVLGKEYGCQDPASWKDVPIQPTVQALVNNSIIKATLGEHMGSDKNVRDAAVGFVNDIVVSVPILLLFWAPLRPLVSLLVTLPNRFHFKKFCRLTNLGVKQRIKQYDEKSKGSSQIQDSNDFLQLLIHQAKQLGEPEYQKPETLSARVLFVVMAAVFTSTYALTQAILDLISHDPQYILEIRKEISSVLAAHDGEWNKSSLAEMLKLDSFMRESQRLNSFVTMAIRRLVISPGGVTTPSGTHVPSGATLATYVLPIASDPDTYSDPHQFKPFRFAGQRTELDRVQAARQAWTATSTMYLPWGHGRHACPGRFAASTMVKAILAHLIMQYDFAMQEERPPNQWMLLARMPPAKATMRLKRRSGL